MDFLKCHMRAAESARDHVATSRSRKIVQVSRGRQKQMDIPHFHRSRFDTMRPHDNLQPKPSPPRIA